MLLPTAYFGNIEYYYHHWRRSVLSIDHAEPWQKQSFRNRCTIINANGLQDLIVPVSRPFGKETTIDQVEISYTEDWQKVHTKSIESAYGRTAYFEFYGEEVLQLINSQQERLIDLNQSVHTFILDKLGLTVKVNYSAEQSPVTENDPRVYLHPKKDSGFKTHRYIQPFEERFGFTPNLSILDLLFNEGPNGITILKESLV